MYQIIGNVYRGEGFVWIRTDESDSELWKYSKHGSFETREEAEKEAEQLNKIYDKTLN